MTEQTQLDKGYFVVSVNDLHGKTARGPFDTALEADWVKNPDEKVVSAKRLQEMRSPGMATEAPTHQAVADFAQMVKESQSWGRTLLIFGVAHLFIAGLSSPWGLMLILVGLASFQLRTAGMFVSYAVTLAWAAISNILSGDGSWVVGGIIQIVLAVQVFVKFNRYRKAEMAYLRAPGDIAAEATAPAQRAAKIFPWLALGLGAVSFGGFGLLLVTVFVTAMVSGSTGSGITGFLEGFLLNLGVLGFAFGLASILCKYPKKLAAIGGMITGLLVIAIELVLFLFN